MGELSCVSAQNFILTLLGTPDCQAVNSREQWSWKSRCFCMILHRASAVLSLWLVWFSAAFSHRVQPRLQCTRHVAACAFKGPVTARQRGSTEDNFAILALCLPLLTVALQGFAGRFPLEDESSKPGWGGVIFFGSAPIQRSSCLLHRGVLLHRICHRICHHTQVVQSLIEALLPKVQGARRHFNVRFPFLGYTGLLPRMGFTMRRTIWSQRNTPFPVHAPNLSHCPQIQGSRKHSHHDRAASTGPNPPVFSSMCAATRGKLSCRIFLLRCNIFINRSKPEPCLRRVAVCHSVLQRYTPTNTHTHTQCDTERNTM